jgi:hypothetical protein
MKRVDNRPPREYYNKVDNNSYLENITIKWIMILNAEYYNKVDNIKYLENITIKVDNNIKYLENITIKSG